MANRTPLLAGALGLATGLVGAFVGAHLATRAAPVRPPSAASGTRAPVVPPGWDPRVAGQVAALEGRLSEAERTLRAAGTTAAAPAVPEPAPVGPGGRGPAREGQRLE